MNKKKKPDANDPVATAPGTDLPAPSAPVITPSAMTSPSEKKPKTKTKPKEKPPATPEPLAPKRSPELSHIHQSLNIFGNDLRDLKARLDNPQVPTPLAFGSMREIMRAVAPLAKKHENEEGGFWFRQIDEIVNVLNPLMAEHGIVPAPEVLSSKRESRPDAEGFNQTWTITTFRVRFFCTIDGSVFPPESVPLVLEGEAMSDMSFSTQAAQTMAFKQALCQVFMIPVFGEDPEAYQGSKPRYVAPQATTTPATAAAADTNAVVPQTGSLFPDMPVTKATTTKRGKGKQRDDNPAPWDDGSAASKALDPADGKPSGGPMSKGALTILTNELKRAGREEAELLAHFKIAKLGDLQTSQMGEVTAFIRSPKQEVAAEANTKSAE